MTARSYLVIGGGIVGVASALRLRAAGFDVTLIDPGDPRRGASFGNAGRIATEDVAPLASPHTLAIFATKLFAFGGPLSFRRQDIALWAPWALKFARACNAFQFGQGMLALDTLQRESMAAWRRLSALTETPPLVTACGHCTVWMSPDAAAHGIAAWQRMPTGPTRFRVMNADELAHVGGPLNAPPAGGLAFAGSGQVAEPQAVRDALLAAFMARGGVFVRASVTSVSASAAMVTALLDSGEALNADAALIAAGAWSGALMRGLGVKTPLIGERGYSVHSAEHEWPADFPPIFFEERAMVVTRFTSGLRASSFVELGSPDAPPDPRKWQRLSHHLRELGIAFSPTPECWIGPRPTLPDFLPAIGRLEQHPRVLYAFGHQHLGMTLASVTAELIESLASWTPPRINAAPFRIERFA